MEIQEFQNLPYIKRQKIVKRLYEKKLMSRSALHKTIKRGRKLTKDEQLLFDKYLIEVENEVPEVIPEKVVKENVTPERKPEPEVVKKKLAIEPKSDVIVDKGAKKTNEGKLVRPEKFEEKKEEKVITKEILQDAIKNAKWNTAAYVNAIAKMDRKNPYGDPSNEDFEKKEIIEEFYNLALYPENFKKIKNLPAFKNI